MSRIAYVNGRFEFHADARIHIEDRGFQFADSVYEVVTVIDGRLKDADGHFRRLERSLDALDMPHPRTESGYRIIIRELLRRNRIRNGLIYIQVSRGVARRDHAFPVIPVEPTLVMTAKRIDPARGQAAAETGVAVITRPDERWARCDIKTVNLLPNVLAKQAAKEAGAAEAWLIDEGGMVTEGSSSNAWILTAENVLVTRQADHGILRGITREQVRRAIADAGYTLEERAFSLEEALAAREAFITSASTYVTPVVSIDGKPVGNGAPGTMAQSLREAYLRLD